MGLINKILRPFREKKMYLCRHPTCKRKFYTKEDMLKHYYPSHEGHPYDPEERKREIDRYSKGVDRAERRIIADNKGPGYEIPGVDNVNMRHKTKYLKPKSQEASEDSKKINLDNTKSFTKMCWRCKKKFGGSKCPYCGAYVKK